MNQSLLNYHESYYARGLFYGDDSAVDVGVLFSRWVDEACDLDITKLVTGIEPYEPGNFYKRELSCILDLLCIEGLHGENLMPTLLKKVH